MDKEKEKKKANLLVLIKPENLQLLQILAEPHKGNFFITVPILRISWPVFMGCIIPHQKVSTPSYTFPCTLLKGRLIGVVLSGDRNLQQSLIWETQSHPMTNLSIGHRPAHPYTYLHSDTLQQYPVF